MGYLYLRREYPVIEIFFSDHAYSYQGWFQLSLWYSQNMLPWVDVLSLGHCVASWILIGLDVTPIYPGYFIVWFMTFDILVDHHVSTS